MDDLYEYQVNECYQERDWEYWYKIDMFGLEEDCWNEYYEECINDQ